MLSISLLGSFGFLLSFFLTYTICRYAEKLGMIDVPNERSTHSVPTPKGGGFAFFLVFTFLMGLMLWSGRVSHDIVGPLFYGSPVVVLLGWMDDRYSLSAGLRLTIHFFVALVIFTLVTDWYAVDFKVSFLPDIFWINCCFCILFVAWFINLFNFMDGSDGLVASTSVVSSLLLAVMTYFYGAKDFALVYVLLAYAVGGFLPLNWRPARIFMGDTGSYFLGFVFATLALMCKIYSNISFYSHIIIFAPLIVDATYTLVVRLVRGERIYTAHRQHAFHKAIDSGWSHQRVVTFFNAVTILWLFPLANLASMFDILGMAFVLLAYLPLLAFEIYYKAGFKEEKNARAS